MTRPAPPLHFPVRIPFVQQLGAQLQAQLGHAFAEGLQLKAQVLDEGDLDGEGMARHPVSLQPRR